ncbi:polysaccharide pyruvyl transferase family protein [Formosa sp. 4Alg 33]|uniref:polysaccharide pyruvyl transferase family protein n=1 Tax=Formosa sp. 4Alg 33 TaxID=3382189 RepID=UPI003D9C4A22
MKKIVLFDPGLENNNGDFSKNLGDLIIQESVVKQLKNVFGDNEIISISTHSEIGKREKSLLKEADFTFVGGSNLMSSDLKKYNQWKNSKKSFFKEVPIVNNAILLGVGWWQYQNTPTDFTSSFYQKLLHSDRQHSVRDGYTKQMLHKAGIDNVINTTCPTIWELDGTSIDREYNSESDLLFMLTDYHPNPELDNSLLTLFLKYFNKDIYYFPQGSGDRAYLESLEVFKKNSNRFKIMQHNINDLFNLVQSNKNLVYIGSRLHGGIKCIHNNVPALILANDNRAIEIKKDVNIPVLEKKELIEIENWIKGETSFGKIKVSLEDIAKWKNQF